MDSKSTADLFAEERDLLAWLDRLKAEDGSLHLAPGQLDAIRRSHDQVLETLSRLTRVSDIAQQQLFRERKKIQAELAVTQDRISKLTELNSEQNDVLALAAHDLRSPVATIDGLAEAIEYLLPEDCDPEIPELLGEIRKIAETSGALISSLMEAYRAAKGQITGSPVTTDISALRAIIDSSWQAAAALKGIEIEQSEEASSEPFQLDVHLFRRIVNNLVSNALKYSPRGTTIEILLVHDHNLLTLEVRDEGAGISESDQRRLFRSFGGISNLPTENENSEGIGLALVQRLLDSLGGRISYSRREPKGSIFHVEIPAPALGDELP